MYTYSFEKLEVWQLARKFRKEIYLLTKKFPDDEKFALSSQIRRSARSIGDCLSEGSGKITQREKAHYTNMAYSSAVETVNHLIGCYDLDYISENEYLDLRVKLEEITRMLVALRQTQLKSS